MQPKLETCETIIMISLFALPVRVSSAFSSVIKVCDSRNLNSKLVFSIFSGRIVINYLIQMSLHLSLGLSVVMLEVLMIIINTQQSFVLFLFIGVLVSRLSYKLEFYGSHNFPSSCFHSLLLVSRFRIEYPSTRTKLSHFTH